MLCGCFKTWALFNGYITHNSFVVFMAFVSVALIKSDYYIQKFYIVLSGRGRQVSLAYKTMERFVKGDIKFTAVHFRFEIVRHKTVVLQILRTAKHHGDV